jgi:transposase
VTKLLGIAWRTVGAIIERIVDERLDPHRLDGLLVIGIDEISYRRHHHYLTLVLDHLEKRIVWAGKGKKAETCEASSSRSGRRGPPN